jgi:hypothetical protein
MRAESSPAARTGAFVAVAVARLRVRPGFSAPNAAVAVPAASDLMAVRPRPGALGTVPPPASGAKPGGGRP